MTEPRAVYETIQLTTPEDLDDRILLVLQTHRGKDHRISRRSLVEAIFGIAVDPDENLANSKEDRQIREAIARLQETYPILSSSGDGGYWLPGSAEEINEYAAEINSRAMKLLEKSRRLVAQAQTLRFDVHQLGLWGE